jgi:anti-sigma B factor antagonist
MASSGQAYLEIDQVGEVTVVRLLRSDIQKFEDVEGMGERLLRVAQELGRRRVVLDLTQVEHMASSMVGKVIALYKELRAGGGKLALCGLRPALAEELDAMRLTQLFKAYPTEAEAVSAVGSG